MRNTRRQFIGRLLGTAGAASFLLANPSPTRAALYGTWVLRCPYCSHDDTVNDGTRQHPCSNCGKQVFSGDKVTVVCPGPDKTPWQINTGQVTDTFICNVCNRDCNTGPHLPKNKPKPDVHDHGD